ncbi:hypothetical protein FN846DRAFT_947681 [Sphaerosporella brunnea]|uniref:Uncharacterized protein n=1 Tax=Sphaerosporella brunnea TaxID=1250544 RepID=A0A5J5EXJ4_9PEZI|nr:hypothetical protein FN846DRAFT_947676 [Sphaerosporella brunnea]KAA8906934.1 hypothetical protein FN846DRAFT_947681 [Sphaerosporella brunnea]
MSTCKATLIIPFSVFANGLVNAVFSPIVVKWLPEMRRGLKGWPKNVGCAHLLRSSHRLSRGFPEISIMHR